MRFLLALAVAILLTPLSASAQAPAKVYRMGVLSMTPINPRSPVQMAFFEELRQRGYVEGQNLSIERRDAAGQVDRLAALAQELARLRVDLIFAAAPQPNRAAKEATSSIPIVMFGVADPVRAGLAHSLARPGGNLTGVATTVPGGFFGKSMELLVQVVPKATRVAVLVNPDNDMHRLLVPNETSDAARQLGVQVRLVEARTSDELEPAIQAAMEHRSEALLVVGDPLFDNPPGRLPQLAARAGLPAMYLSRVQAQAGGLLSYGPDFVEMGRRAAIYVDRILRGAKPGEMAIEQPTRFELVLNLKTARSLGLTIPQSMLLRADSVIE